MVRLGTVGYYAHALHHRSGQNKKGRAPATLIGGCVQGGLVMAIAVAVFVMLILAALACRWAWVCGYHRGYQTRIERVQVWGAVNRESKTAQVAE